MRRRVVCPRSHPASPYLRRPSGVFASARSFPRGGRPPGTPGWDAYPVGRQLRPWCVGPLAAPWSLGLMVCPDTSVGAAVCTFKQRCARLEGTHSPPEILTRAPTSGPETRPPRCRRVRRQPSRELPAAVRSAGHWTHTGPSPRAAGSPRWAGGGLPGRGVLPAAREPSGRPHPRPPTGLMLSQSPIRSDGAAIARYTVTC